MELHGLSSRESLQRGTPRVRWAHAEMVLKLARTPDAGADGAAREGDGLRPQAVDVVVAIDSGSRVVDAGDKAEEARARLRVGASVRVGSVGCDLCQRALV